MHPQKHPKLWVLLLLLFSGQERVKPPFPLKASPVQVLARGPAQGAGVSPCPQEVAPGHTGVQTEHHPLLQHLDSPKRAKLPLTLQTGSAEAGTVFIARNWLL